MSDPMERMIRHALLHAEEPFHDDQRLDFWLPNRGVYIEVKQFHSPRIADQMASQPEVIAVQGRKAVAFMAHLLTRLEP